MTRVNYTIRKHKADIFEAINDKDRENSLYKRNFKLDFMCSVGFNFF
jgi:hypothetical protein